jgi:hypothetical protein
MHKDEVHLTQVCKIVLFSKRVVLNIISLDFVIPYFELFMNIIIYKLFQIATAIHPLIPKKHPKPVPEPALEFTSSPL